MRNLMRILATFAFVLALAPMNLTYASAKSLDGAVAPAGHARAVVRDLQSGQQVEIPVAVTSQNHTITYNLIVPSGTCIGCSDSGSLTDSTATVRMTVRLVYDEVPCSYTRCTRLLYSQGYLQRLDPQVKLSGGWIKNSCLGYFNNAQGLCATTEKTTVGTTTNTWYTANVHWGSVPVQSAGTAYVASRMHVDITRGTRKWSLEVCVAETGQPLADCFIG